MGIFVPEAHTMMCPLDEIVTGEDVVLFAAVKVFAADVV
jgi:hypothetical protein